jgi:hypothetical protein
MTLSSNVKSGQPMLHYHVTEYKGDTERRYQRLTPSSKYHLKSVIPERFTHSPFHHLVRKVSAVSHST